MEHKFKVLIVDDQETNIACLVEILSEYTVYSARSGEKAIAAAEKFLPDLILLDILMPGMDGYAVAEKLKESALTRHIPIIFITSLDGAHDEKKGLDMGAADYITKPFSSDVVKLRVKNQIKMLEQIRASEHKSMIDSLTELDNRRSFEKRLDSEWRRAMRDKLPISVLMVDVDNFKKYNDKYGHQQGDEAMKMLGRAFRETLKRSGDFAARWGGEEFALLLSGVDMDGAVTVAENVRKYVESMDIPCLSGSEASKITVSIGANTWDNEEGLSKESFISEADTALYAAKTGGKNMVVHYKRKE